MQIPTPILAVVLALSGAACDKADDTKQAAAEAKAPEPNADASAPTDTAKPAKMFEKDQRKKACEMLPPAMVATVLDVPETDLKQMKIGGCLYSYQGSDEHKTVEAALMTIWVHKTAEDARSRFDHATQDQTAEQLRAQMGVVTEQAKEHESVDTKTKKQTVGQMGGLMAAAIPDAGYHYEDVDGIGDATRVLTHDGSLTVLVGNMVFNVRAYAGEPEPKPEITSTDLDAIMAASKQANDAWLDKTREQRKQQSIALARAIVAAL